MKLFDSIKNFFKPKAKPVVATPASFGSTPPPLKMAVVNKLSGLESKPLPKDFFNLETTPKIDVQKKLATYGKDVQSKINSDPVANWLHTNIVSAIPRAVATVAKTTQGITGDVNTPYGISSIIDKFQKTPAGSAILANDKIKSVQDVKKEGTKLGAGLFVGGTLLDLIPGGAGVKNIAEEGFGAVAKALSKNIKLGFEETPKVLHIHNFDTKSLGNEGKGFFKKSIEVAKQYADMVGKKLTIVPGDEFGSDKKRLTDTFKSFGFIPDETGAGSKLKYEPSLKQPSLPKTFAKNPTISDEIKNSIDQLRYKPITNVETLDEANKIIDKDIDGAVTYFRDIKKPDRVSNTVGQLLVKRLQDAGRMDDAIDIAVKLTDDATKSGQAVQVFSIINRLSPEGVLKYTVRSINRAGGDAKKVITPEFAQKITKAAEDIQKLPEGSREKQVETAKLLRDIMDEVPKGILKKISSFQTLAQLLNPKTMIRNLLGGSIFNIAENVKDVPASVLDYATSAITGTRTTSLPDIMANIRGFRRGLAEGTEEAITGINTSRSTTMYDINKQNVFKKGSPLSYAEKALNVLNTSVDRGFYEAAFDGAIAKMMKAKGITDATKVTDDMIEDAAAEAAYRTFQDDSAIASAFSRIKKTLNFDKDFGLGDFIIKYPRVPGNILSRGIAYSPIGFVNTVLELGKPLIGKPFNQKQFVESTARALTGTAGLFGTGALLGKLGIITGSEKRDDYKTQNFKREVGLGKYKINITGLKRFIASGMDPEEAKLQEGDTLASYDWAQPLSLALAMGADYNENKGSQDSALNKLSQIVSNMSDVAISATESFEQQSMVRSIKDLFGGDTIAEGLGKVGTNIPTSFVPTVIRQFRNIIDDDARITSGNDPFTIAYRKTLNAVPGLSQTLQPDVGSLGENKPVFGATKNNLWNVFFNPSFVAKYKPSKEAKVVLDVFKDSGDSGAIPRRYTKYVQLGNEQKNITPEQQRYYQRFLGKITKSSLTNLVDNKDATIDGKKFYELSDEDKAKELDSLFTDINSAAKITLFGYKPKKITNRTRNLIKYYEQDPFVHKEKGVIK